MADQSRQTLFAALLVVLMSGCTTPGVPLPGTVIVDDSPEVSFTAVDAAIAALNDTHGADQVLVVLDIDNTLLTSGVDLGGDVWYQWQRGRLDIEPTAEQQVSCLFEDAIGLLYELGPMRLTDESLPNRVRGWQDNGNAVFALTSRSPRYRAATERELDRLGIDLTRSAPGGTAQNAMVLREMAEREWSYMRGVMMTTGMNKATMLQTLLDRTGTQFAAIVFVDDTRRHIDHMSAALEESSVDARIFHYRHIELQREHANGTVLTADQAEKMAADWQQLDALLKRVFPGRDQANGCLGQ